MIESFFLKIASGVLGKGIAANLASTASTALQIHSVFEAVDNIGDCVNSLNTSDSFPDRFINIVSDKMTERVVEKLLDLGEDTISIERKKSGLYVATKICKPIFIPELQLTRERRWTGATIWQTGR